MIILKISKTHKTPTKPKFKNIKKVCKEALYEEKKSEKKTQLELKI